VQSRRNKCAAKKFFRKLLKGLQYIPRTVITDKLRSYEAAKAEVMPSVEHHRDKGLNNRAENSHQPTRERERRMRGFKLNRPDMLNDFLRPSVRSHPSSVQAAIYWQPGTTGKSCAAALYYGAKL
jgi:transposase-like protein